MAKKYEIVNYQDLNFYFALDYTKESDTYIPHIFNAKNRQFNYFDAINTYLNITKQIFNIPNNRWEAYSEQTKLGLLYVYKQDKKEILIISLFYPNTEYKKKLKIN